ncbi:hypothetical protein [Halobacillus karajensis]
MLNSFCMFFSYSPTTNNCKFNHYTFLPLQFCVHIYKTLQPLNPSHF